MKSDPEVPHETRALHRACNAEKARRGLRIVYLLSAGWTVLSLAWVLYMIFHPSEFNGWVLVILLAGFFNCLISIINNKRILKGRKPL